MICLLFAFLHTKSLLKKGLFWRANSSFLYFQKEAKTNEFPLLKVFVSIPSRPFKLPGKALWFNVDGYDYITTVLIIHMKFNNRIYLFSYKYTEISRQKSVVLRGGILECCLLLLWTAIKPLKYHLLNLPRDC